MTHSKTNFILLIAGISIESVYILYRVIMTGASGSVIKYIALYGAAFIIMAIAHRVLKQPAKPRTFLSIIIFFAFISGVTLIPAPPEQSDDIYRYIWDGKLQHFDISPYTYAPDAPVLEQYHSEKLPRLVNFPHIKTIYPPAAQLLFRISYELSGENPTGMKFLFLLFAIGSIYLFYLILKLRGGDLRLLIFFAWNPLLIMETAVNGHLDILMVFFLLLCLWLFYKNRLIFAGMALGMAVLSKLIPVIFVPLFLLYLWNRHLKQPLKPFRFLIPLVLTIGGFYAVYFKSAQNMFLTAVNYSTKWYFNNPVFRGILGIFKENAIAHIVSFSLFCLIFLVILTRPWELEKKIFFVATAFVLFNPTIHPWYLIILVSLLCIHRSPAIMWWSGLSVISYVVVYRFKATGSWEDSLPVMALEYVPILILILRDFYLYFFSPSAKIGKTGEPPGVT